jgi:hypothetical protein
MIYEHGEPGSVLSLNDEAAALRLLEETLLALAEMHARDHCDGSIHEAWLAIYSTAEKHATLAEQAGY